MSTSETARGSCNCGTIKWTTTATPEPDTLSRCYCRSCQKCTGTAFIATAALSLSTLKINSIPGETLFSDPGMLSTLFSIRETNMAQRARCRNCGCPVYMRYYKSHGDRITISLGTLDWISEGSEDVWRNRMHLFVGEAPLWYQIPEDGLPRYEMFDPPFQESLEELGLIGRK